MSSRRGLCVGPIEIIENPVGFLARHRATSRIGLERSLTALPLFPYESVGKLDIGQMILAGDGILEGVTMTLAYPLSFEDALGPAAVDSNPGLHQPLHFKGRPEKLPRQAP